MKKIINQYVCLITQTNRLLFIAISWTVFIIASIMMIEVVSRYLFNTPTSWGMELSTLLFGPYFLLGGPYLLHIRGHVNLDLVHASLSSQIREKLDILNQVIIFLFCAILLYYSWPLAMQSWEYKETSFSAWNPQIWPAKFAIPVSVIMLGAQSMAELMLLVTKPLPESE